MWAWVQQEHNHALNCMPMPDVHACQSHTCDTIAVKHNNSKVLLIEVHRLHQKYIFFDAYIAVLVSKREISPLTDLFVEYFLLLYTFFIFCVILMQINILRENHIILNNFVANI